MRFTARGGVWKNAEDEILKLAVMKYGKNHWGRAASLLPNKTAKQCKARWSEWLDPAIRKTEWTRQEDEKLLHMARIMPTQWRTIAPVVGRTPAQCLERYERLLDAAQGEEDGGGAAAAEADVKKLRPGEIDPTPESRPARPDAVDMDEDEQEMINEARARLANTRGKKAKRRARERQLEEARRMAALQKRRELRAAGIKAKPAKRKRHEFDHNAEIPLEEEVPRGVHDTTDDLRRTVEERRRRDATFRATDRAVFDGEDPADREERERKKDAKRKKVHREHNLPEALLRAARLNSVTQTRFRPALALPAPHVSDRELEDLAKLGGAAAGAAAAAGRTPARTPLAPSTVLADTKRLHALQRLQTPLGVAGDETPAPAGADPLADAAAMPPPPPPPPSSRAAAAAERRRQRAEEKAAAERLRTGLRALPAPTREYAVVRRGGGAGRDGEAAAAEYAPAVADAEDEEEQARRRADEARRAELARRTQAVQRGLPRPARAPPAAAHETPVDAEVRALVAHDAAAHPARRRKDRRPAPAAPLERIDDAALARARDLVDAEARGGNVGVAAVAAALEAAAARRREAASSSSRPVDALRAEFEALQRRAAAGARGLARAEQRASLPVRGYEARASRLAERSAELHAQLASVRERARCFAMLQRAEEAAFPARLARAEDEVARLRAREAALQARYQAALDAGR